MTRAAMFAALRPHAPNGKIPPEDIPVIDGLADRWGIDREGARALTPSRACIALIKEFEGCRLKAYPDPGSGGVPWTIGWGSTRDELGQPIKPGTVWTQERADARIADEVGEFAEKVAELIGGAPTTQQQFDAMVSLAYNIGTGNFGSSTLLKKHKAGDYAGAEAQFAVWNKAAGKVMAGLTRRRAAEAEMYRRAA